MNLCTDKYFFLQIYVITQAGYKLTYQYSGNMIHFSFFVMQFFPTTQKTTISKSRSPKPKSKS